VRFTEQWRATLDDFGLEEFHANRFWSAAKGRNIKEYGGWDERKASRFINRLLNIIDSHRVHPFGSAVVMSDWKALPPDEHQVLTGAAYSQGKTLTPGARKKTFFLPFAHAVQKATSHCPDGQKLDFFFDDNDSYKPNALDYYGLMTSLSGPVTKILGRISFVDSKVTPGIQAADLLAYEINNYMKERIAQGTEALVEPRPVLARALHKLKSRNLDLILWDKKGMDIALERYRGQKAKR